MLLSKEKLRKYLEYASTDEARAVLFVQSSASLQVLGTPYLIFDSLSK
jgi:hypothetical protein